MKNGGITIRRPFYIKLPSLIFENKWIFCISTESTKITPHAHYPLRFARISPIINMSFGTMDINALVINGLDPGAVPGDSTNHPLFGDGGGRNRIDKRLKRLALFRLGATVSAQNVQLQITIVLQWRWLRKQPELLKLKSLRLAT